MKDLRTRRGSDLEVDLEGPSTWTRGDAWDDERRATRYSIRVDDSSTSTRHR